MENASKALIIAGAILLAILIIGLGMFIFNKGKGALNGANMDQQKVAAYNGEFEQYEGTQSGTQARALCDLIRTHNNANVDDASLNIELVTSEANKTEALTTPVTTKAVNDIKTTIKAGNTYTVSFSYDQKSGFIVQCGIVKK